MREKFIRLELLKSLSKVTLKERQAWLPIPGSNLHQSPYAETFLQYISGMSFSMLNN